MLQSVEYLDVVRAAHDTAEKLLNRDPNARQWHVYVDTQGGQTACVDWQERAASVTMSLPSFAPDTRMTRAEADEIVGFIAHETCHVRHTDMRAWKRAVKAGDLIRNLTNAIEDVRIEAREIAGGHMPNLRNVLSATLNAKHWDSVQGRKAKGMPASRERPAGRGLCDLRAWQAGERLHRAIRRNPAIGHPAGPVAYRAPCA